MFENVFFYLFLCLLFFGIGDVLGTLTKAKLSSVFVSLFLFLICFVTGLIPPDIIKQAGLTEVGKWVTPFIVFSMGTSINLREFIAEWRTLVTAIFSMVVVAIAGLAMIPLIGYNETIVSVPIINGGIVATQIMTSAALEHGMNLAAALGAIVYAVQKFVGTPIASYYGIREARVLIEEYRRTGGAVAKAKTEQKAGAEKTVEAPAKPNFFESHKKYYGVFVSLAITAFFAWVAFVLGKWTGLASSIWALILGTLVSATGMLPKNILKHSNSSGIFNVFIFATIIPSLAQIRLEDLSTLAYALVVLFVVTCAVLYLLRAALLEASRFAKPCHGRFRGPASRVPGDLPHRQRSGESRRRKRSRNAVHLRPSDAEVPCLGLCNRDVLLGHHGGHLPGAPAALIVPRGTIAAAHVNARRAVLRPHFFHSLRISLK